MWVVLAQHGEGVDPKVTLRHFEEATNEEVARILGVSAATASRCYTRALQSLRTFLDRSGRRRDT